MARLETHTLHLTRARSLLAALALMSANVGCGSPENAQTDAGPTPDGTSPDAADMWDAAPLDPGTHFDAVTDAWIRETEPDVNYEDDLVSVWSSDSDDGGRRYGLATFDLSSLAGQTITAAEIQLNANTGFSGHTRAIRQRTLLVTGAAAGITWNTYHATLADSAYLLEGLRFDLAPGEGGGTYLTGTPASEGDLAAMQAVIDGGGVLTLVFQADEEGMDYRQDWGDQGRDTNPPRLFVRTGTTGCAIATSALEGAVQAAPYQGQLAHTAGCPADARWQLGSCGLPPGLSLDAASGLITGTPEYGGPYPLDVELTGAGGEILATREVRLEVQGIVDTRADLDHDGDVDSADAALFDAAYTGPAVSVIAVHDASVRPGVNADTNFDSVLGDIVPIEVDNAPANPGNDTWKGYLQFDVSALGVISGAELRLRTDASFGGPVPNPLRVDVFGLRDGNDGWDETTITWNNAPANVNDEFDLDSTQVYGAGPLGTFTTTGGADVFRSPVLDAFLQSEVGADGLVTLVLVVESDTGQDGDYTVFYSHEAAGLEPTLASTGVVSAADFDGDGDVDEDDRAVLLASTTGALSGAVDMCWRRHVERALDTLLEVGTDTHGMVQTAMLMSVIDLRTLEAPSLPQGEPCPGEDITAEPAGYPADACLRTEGRPDHGRLSQGGANLWLDGPTVRTMYQLSGANGDARYRDAADAYISAVFEHARKDAMPVDSPANRTLIWGSHSYYDAYADAPGGELWSSGPLVGEPIHEILIKQPEWGELYRIDPLATSDAIQSIWDWHVIDPATGLHNRHDSSTGGVLDFAYSGGSFTLAFAFMYQQTGLQDWLARAALLVQHHLDAADPVTGLVPDAPSATTRFDGSHMMTSVSGPYATQLLRSYELTGDPLFRDTAVEYIVGYDQYGWDPVAGTHYGMLALDGTPQVGGGGGGYDAWAPAGHVNVWRSAMYSYEFAIAAAQASAYAHALASAADKDRLLQVAEHWAQTIESELPPRPGKRFGDVLTMHLPAVAETQGTYAENYGRAISFFVNLYHATCETTCNPAYLQRANLLAHEAVEKLSHPSGLFRGHPAKDTYQSSDGVGFLLHALMELDALPNRWQPAL